MKKAILLMLTLLSFNKLVIADCTKLFPNALQTIDGNFVSSIDFKCNARILNPSDFNLFTNNLFNPELCNPTCGHDNCEALILNNQLLTVEFNRTLATKESNILTKKKLTIVGEEGVFDYFNLDINKNNEVEILDQQGNNIYKFNKITMDAESVLHLPPGEYWVNELVINGDNAAIKVKNNGLVKFYVYKYVKINKTFSINYPSNNLEKIFVFYPMSGFENMSFGKASTIDGFLISNKNVILQNLNLTGAVLANNVELDKGVKINFNDNVLTAIDKIGLKKYIQNGLQTFSEGKVKFACGSHIATNSLQVAAKSIQNPVSECTMTCGDKACKSRKTNIEKLDKIRFKKVANTTSLTAELNGEAYEANSLVEYKQILLKNNAKLTFYKQGEDLTTNFKIKNLIINGNAEVNFVAGDYWIENFFIPKPNDENTVIKFNFIGEGTARIHINNSLIINNRIVINDNNSAKNFLFLIGRNFALKEPKSTANAFFYVEGTTEIAENSKIVGAITSNQIVLAENTEVKYDPLAMTLIDFGDMLTPSDKSQSIKVMANNFAVLGVPVDVAVTATDGDNNPIRYAKTVILDTGVGSGSWENKSGHGFFNSPGDGVAIYTFHEDDKGKAEFALTYNGTEKSININLKEQGGVVVDENQNGLIIFSDAGIVINLPNNVLTSGTETFADLELIADKSKPYSSITGTRNLDFWFEYIDPKSANIPMIKINDIAISSDMSSTTTIPIEFKNGKAKVRLIASDVGVVQIFCRDASILDDGILIQGSTPFLTSKPANFTIEVASPEGNKFIAGKPFEVKVVPVNATGQTLVNFGNENNPVGIIINSIKLIAPASGINGTNNDGYLINNTEYTVTNNNEFIFKDLIFDEVGIISLGVSIDEGDYLGVGNIKSSESNPVGPFIPDHFTVEMTPLAFAAGCPEGGFTYFNQPFYLSKNPILNIQARDANDNLVHNYKDEFYKISDANIKVTYKVNNAHKVELLSPDANADVKLKNLPNGITQVDLGSGRTGFMLVKKTEENIPPMNAEIQLAVEVVDDDGVTSKPHPFFMGATTRGDGIGFHGGNKFYDGRLHTHSVVGLENKTLHVPFLSEYFDGKNFVTNHHDVCTVFNNPDWVKLKFSSSDMHCSAFVGSTPFVNGVGTLTLSPPLVKGSVEINLDVSKKGADLPWFINNMQPTTVKFGVENKKSALIYQHKFVEEE